MAHTELDLDSISQFAIKLALDVSLVLATTYSFFEALNYPCVYWQLYIYRRVRLLGKVRKNASPQKVRRRMRKPTVLMWVTPVQMCLSGRYLIGRMQLVTEVDKAVEKFIVERIREAYPSHKL